MIEMQIISLNDRKKISEIFENFHKTQLKKMSLMNCLRIVKM